MTALRAAQPTGIPEGRRRRGWSARPRLASPVLNGCLALFIVVWLLPVIALAVTSFAHPVRTVASGWWWTVGHPSALTLQNYQQVLDNPDLVRALLVTVKVTIGATALTAVVGTAAGYSLAWHRFPGRNTLFVLIVALLIVPIQTSLIPMFRLYNATGLYDTVLGLVLYHTAYALPFAIFLFRNFFANLPVGLIDAARVDGASDGTIFRRIVLPLGLPAVAAVAILQGMAVWNDLIVGLTMAQNNQPLIPVLVGELGRFESNLGLIAAGAFITVTVPLLVFLILQRYFVRGLLAGAVK